MSHSNVPLATILERFKAHEERILARTTTSTSSATPVSLTSATPSKASPPSPPLSPSTRPATTSQLADAPRAAVLLGLFTHPRTGEVNVLLTLRSATLNSHHGEVSLPGGRRDNEDGGDDVVTALREAEEEVGLDRSLATAHARTRRVFSKKGLIVTPIVAAIPVPSYIAAASSATAAPAASFTPHLNGAEVAAMFCLPLHTFLSAADYRYEDRPYDIYTYRMHFFTRRTAEWIEVDAEPPTAESSALVNWRVAEAEREFLVWGMTAGVLVAAARVAFDAAPEFAAPPLVARKGVQPASAAASVMASEEATLSQSNL